jgi:ATP-dependent RNA helicase DeaD
MQTFNELGLKDEILASLEAIGFETPTRIQAKAIPHILSSDTDLIAYAQTGTGKTAAFSLPILNRINVQSKKVQAIVLCPTRELCLQIGKDVESFSSKIKKLRYTAVYGGASIGPQISDIRRGSQIVVGTPGRTLDLIRRGVLDLSHIQWVVLDEADEMLSMGFAEDLRTILAETPAEKQTLLFSATIPPEMRRIADAYMHEPVEISAGSKKVSNTNVRHTYVLVQARQRFDALKRLIDVHPDLYAIIFCRTRRETTEVSAMLSRGGYNADFLNGELSQAQRDQVMKRFREGQLQLLVATDIAARGLDVDELTHVFHYNLPDELDVYVHRSGRTGRAGNEGMSVALLTRRDRSRLRYIENNIGRKMEQLPLPRIDQILRRHGVQFAQKLIDAKPLPEQLKDSLKAVNERLEGLSREELIEKMMSLSMQEMAKQYEGVSDKDLSRPDNFSEEKRQGKKKQRNPDMEEFVINLGKKQKFSPGLLLDLVNSTMRGSDKPDIGHIQIHKHFSTFQMPPKFTGDLLRGMRNARFKGKAVWVTPAGEAKQRDDGKKRLSRRPGRKRRR